jgi:hypothetical protein
MTDRDFTPPITRPKFVKYWNMYLADINNRDNLKPSHLQQLKILCDLSVEYDEISELIQMHGRTYESEGRNGFQIKLRPEIQQLNRVVSEIRAYSSLLGIKLLKDTSVGKVENNEFED